MFNLKIYPKLELFSLMCNVLSALPKVFYTQIYFLINTFVILRSEYSHFNSH